MFRVASTRPPLPIELVEKAKRIEPATLGHVVNHGFALGLRPVTTANSFAGTAITVRVSPMDSTAFHYAVDQVQPGHVVVVDMGADNQRACLGAMVCFALSLRGAAGVVIDGMATDIADLEATGVPVFARGLSPVTTRILGNDGDINLPISVAGAVVRPGDLVIADANGVVFVDPTSFEGLYDHLIDMQNSEGPAKNELRAGARISDKYGAAEFVKRSAVYIPD